ncbi:MAG: hypothetical protein JXQ65_00860 [Candidatus Marinimicrobia bacterium]|nr:hypothetical protein [Candidatus Neomarinimicrobiota bacterium]
MCNRKIANNMKFIRTTLTILSFIILLSGQEVYPPANVDFRYHEINNVKLAVGNVGNSAAAYFGQSGMSHALIFPKSSNNTFLAYHGIWIGAIVNGDTLCSVSGAYNDTKTPGGDYFEFAPQYNPKHIMYSTSIFEKQNPDINPNAVVDFFNEDGTLSDNYFPISQEDLICQFYDNVVTFSTPEAPEIFKLHEPMDAHVIQRSFAWDNEWYNDIIFIDYFIINENEFDWEQLYLGIYSDPHSGDFSKGITLGDDISYWDEDGKFMVQGDHPGTGSDDFPNNELVGFEVLGIALPGGSVTIEGLNTRFWSWEGGPKDPHINSEFYTEMSKNEIDRTYSDQITGSMRGLIAKGPYATLAPGDTIRITCAIAGGNGIIDLRENIKAARSLYSADFQVPKAPNPPKFELGPVSHGIKIDWRWKEDYEGYDPVETVDNSRIDGITRDFDGFKVYRSEESEYGPWTLIAQFDSINGSGYDTGLEFDYTDTGLKNGIRYWYTVTSIDLRDDSSGIGPLESPKSFLVKSTVPGPSPEDSGNDEVYVVPNPYRADMDYSHSPAWEYPTQDLRDDWYEIDRRIAFMNLPAKCDIQIFTINGILVNELNHDRDEKGHNIASWNLLNKNNHTVGSGIYYFVVQGKGSDQNFKQVGKFVIVK